MSAPFNLTRLHAILADTTRQYRDGPVYRGTPELVAQAEADFDPDKGLQGGGVLEVYAMPPVVEAPVADKIIDCHFLKIAVDAGKAEGIRDELVSILDAWPSDELAGGPSYITVGATIGDQGAAFQLFALGEVLGLWSVLTPKTFGATGEMADQLAGSGFIMMSGYRPARALGTTSTGEA